MSNHKVKGINIASMLVAAFSFVRFQWAKQQALAMPRHTGRGHSQGRKSKGSCDHSPAGTKLQRMAAAGTLTKKGSESNG